MTLSKARVGGGDMWVLYETGQVGRRYGGSKKVCVFIKNRTGFTTLNSV